MEDIELGDLLWDKIYSLSDATRLGMQFSKPSRLKPRPILCQRFKENWCLLLGPA